MRNGTECARRALLFAVIVAVLLAIPAAASAAVVVNGGFETGTLAGWTEQDQAGSAGSWYVYSTSSPLTGHPIPAPPQGSFAAITDQTDVSSSILYQNITLKPKEKHILSLYVYYTSYAPISSPPTLDYTTSANQQYRIDVMNPSSSLTSVSSPDILDPVFATVTGAPEVMAPTVITANLSQFAGQTVRLRLAMVDNENYFNAGADDVMVTSTPVVKTRKASKVRHHSARLNGSVTPNGGPTTYYFQYGKTKHYGKKTKANSAGLGNAAEKEFASIKHLKPGTKYHFRIVAENAAATSHGKDHTFTTA